MRTNPFYDTLLVLIRPDSDHDASGVRYLLIVLFLCPRHLPVLFFFFFLIFCQSNWDVDPAERKPEHVATWFMRTFIGYMWFQGSLWKLPLPVSDGFRY